MNNYVEAHLGSFSKLIQNQLSFIIHISNTWTSASDDDDNHCDEKL